MSLFERLSGHQTQAGDLSREEGVEDEDDGLWTRVEVQLLQREGKTQEKERTKIMQNIKGIQRRKYD